MKYLATLLLACSLFTGCVHQTYQSTVAHRASTADQVVLRVNELQNAAIAANTNKALSDGDTRIIVTFCVDADKTLAATPSGWSATVLTAWTAAKSQIHTQDVSVIAAMGAVDAVLGGVQ